MSEFHSCYNSVQKVLTFTKLFNFSGDEKIVPLGDLIQEDAPGTEASMSAWVRSAKSKNRYLKIRRTLTNIV